MSYKLLFITVETSALPNKGIDSVMLSGTTNSGMEISIEGISSPYCCRDRPGVVKAGGKLRSSVDFPPSGTGIAIVKRLLFM